MIRKAFAVLSIGILLSLAGCAGVTVTTIPVRVSVRITPASFLFDQNQCYRGFSALPSDCTPEKAVSDGCVVIVDDSSSIRSQESPESFVSTETSESSGASLYGGKERWNEFLSSSEAGMDAALRVVYFQNGTVSYFDLYYIKGKYRAFDTESDDLHDRPYSLLRRLTGTDGNPPRESALFVLTDSNELTFEDVLRSFYSDDRSDATDIPFRWLGFTVFLSEP